MILLRCATSKQLARMHPIYCRHKQRCCVMMLVTCTFGATPGVWNNKLDVDDASPMSSYSCFLRPTWMISSLCQKYDEARVISAFRHKSTSQNSISNFSEKYQILGFPWCSTREDLSIDVSITIVGLILTKPRWFQLIVTSRNSNFELFWKKFKFLSFHAVVPVKTFLLMYQLPM